MSSLKPKVGAYVLIVTEPGAELDVVNELRKKACVKEAYDVQGVYDCIASIETEKDKIAETVRNEIRTIRGVRSTLTNSVAYGKNGPLGFIKDEKGRCARTHTSI